MAIKGPELKKCCFCVPIRYGLLAWGYIKLIALTALLVCHTVYVTLIFGFYNDMDAILGLGFLITAVIFCVVFIIGAHMKNYNLLRIYYVYIIVEVVMGVIAYVIFIIINLSYQIEDACCMNYAFIAMYIILGIVSLITEIYIIFLLRSEIIKLDSNRRFKFVNTEEGECTLSSEENGAKNNVIED